VTPDETPDKPAHTTPDTPSRLRADRRTVLAGGLGAVLGGGAVGSAGLWYARSNDPQGNKGATAVSLSDAPPLQWFESTRLFAPEVSVWRQDGATPSEGLTFTTPRVPTFRAVAFDHDGSPVWIDPDGHSATGLRVQSYRGRPVLTYWTGLILDGTGNGKGVLLDETYATVAEVRMGNGVLADMHEFQLTSRGTALFTSYPTYVRDLSAVGGPTEGYVWGARIQEVDVATGEVLFDWEGLDHIDLEESYQELGDKGSARERPWDPVHANSVEEDGDDHLLVSARHTSALYRIDKRTGDIVWRCGGKRSDIRVPRKARFHWQHDLRRHRDGTITIYDNHARAIETDEVSAALRLEIDEDRKRARLVRALRHEDRYGYAMGNAQFLDDDHVVVGWGTDPVVTEFDERGEAIWELRGLGMGSYQAHRMPWTGRPTTRPDVAVGRDGAAYCSWNGATEVASWRVLTGSSRDRLRPDGEADRDGFETRVEVSGDTTWYAAEALDAGGEVLGRSGPTRRLGG